MNYLPSEIIIDVLSRLPVRSVACCKCVCKSWLRLLETNDFVQIHLSKSLPGLLVPDYNVPSYSYLVFDLEDRVPYFQSEVSKLVTMFNIPIHSSSDGLLFLHHRDRYLDQIYICNPTTRDCIELHYPQELVSSTEELLYFHWSVVYGFGRSKITGQHKVVGIRLDDLEKISKFGCQVYTLEAGSWRTINIAPGPTFRYGDHPPAFVNGNLHWLVFDSDDNPWISCFDLETELFTTFPTPVLSHGGYCHDAYAFGDYLCLNADMGYYGIENENFVWVMKDYGVENSWTKEFIDIFRRSIIMDGVLHTPSFLSLKSFVRENVCSF